jgi:hypothetical protein
MWNIAFFRGKNRVPLSSFALPPDENANVFHFFRIFTLFLEVIILPRGFKLQSGHLVIDAKSHLRRD